MRPLLAQALCLSQIGVFAIAPAMAKPLWEAGAGVAALSLPDYRGSDQRRSYALPFPYFVYRGERLLVDRQGMRAKLFDSDRIHLDASFTGNFALRSDDNRARAGMSPLYPVIEAGPELVYTIQRAARSGGTTVDLRLAARAAFAVGGGRVSHQGFTASPYLRLHNRDLFGTGFDWSASAGLLYGSARYHGYLYSVDSGFATLSRPAYSAPGGYAGTTAQVGAGRRFGDLWVGGFIRYDSLSGASFEASPLVRSRSYATAGIAVSWVFGASSQQGRDDD